jgi:VanZ family protein
MNQKNKILACVFGILYLILIIYFIKKSFENGETSTESSEAVANIIKNVLNKLFNANIEMTDNYLCIIRKLVGHFGFNVVLGVVSTLFYINLCLDKKITLLLHYIIGFVVAFSSEFLCEAFTSGRSASFYDVLIDYSGFILISTILFIIFFVKKDKEIA